MRALKAERVVVADVVVVGGAVSVVLVVLVRVGLSSLPQVLGEAAATTKDIKIKPQLCRPLRSSSPGPSFAEEKKKCLIQKERFNCQSGFPRRRELREDRYSLECQRFKCTPI